MAEVAEESTHVWSAQQRIALFLAAMRHFARDMQARAWPLDYTHLDEGPGISWLGSMYRWVHPEAPESGSSSPTAQEFAD